jgi:hypothetical protein
VVTDEGKTIEGWEDPPARQTRYDWEDIAKRLKRRPNKWAKVFDRDRTSLAVALRSGSISALRPDKGYEVRTANGRREAPRTCTLYMRYVPEKDERRKKDD